MGLFHTTIRTYQPAEIEAMLRDPGDLVARTTMHFDPVDKNNRGLYLCVPEGTPTDKTLEVARRMLVSAGLWTPDHDRTVCGDKRKSFLDTNVLVEALCMRLNDGPLIVAHFSSLAEPSCELRFASWKRSLGFESRYEWD
jgi:hypothetical protein